MTKDYARGGEPAATWTDETTVYASDDESDFVCGVSQDHPYREGDAECRECGADLSAWGPGDYVD